MSANVDNVANAAGFHDCYGLKVKVGHNFR